MTPSKMQRGKPKKIRMLLHMRALFSLCVANALPTCLLKRIYLAQAQNNLRKHVSQRAYDEILWRALYVTAPSVFQRKSWYM